MEDYEVTKPSVKENSGKKKGIVKVIVAILFLVIGTGGLLFWEMYGREAVNYEERLVAAVEITEGTVITEKMLSTANFTKETAIKYSLKADKAKSLIGMRATQDIPVGQQLHASYFEVEEEYISENESIFRIPAAWIDMRSASIRKGDVVDIYGEKNDLIGRFKVAFVKDEQEREITNTVKANKTLDRTESNGVVNSVEIITDIETYNILKSRAYNPDTEVGERYTIVQVIK